MLLSPFAICFPGFLFVIIFFANFNSNGLIIKTTKIHIFNNNRNVTRWFWVCFLYRESDKWGNLTTIWVKRRYTKDKNLLDLRCYIYPDEKLGKQLDR